MAESMSQAESELRSELTRSVNKLRKATKHIPVINLIAQSDLPSVVRAHHDAVCALRDAERLTEELASLDAATEEAALLATTSRVALSMISHSLALLCAELDSRVA